MSWSEVAVVFFISHAVGDYLLQTDWQAIHKRGGLSHDGVARRALAAHVMTYMTAFVPALLWFAIEIGVPWAATVACLIAIPHLVQDDRRLVDLYMRRVKHCDPAHSGVVSIFVDQSFHAAALFLVALLVSVVS